MGGQAGHYSCTLESKNVSSSAASHQREYIPSAHTNHRDELVRENCAFS